MGSGRMVLIPCKISRRSEKPKKCKYLLFLLLTLIILELKNTTAHKKWLFCVKFAKNQVNFAYSLMLKKAFVLRNTHLGELEVKHGVG